MKTNPPVDSDRLTDELKAIAAAGFPCSITEQEKGRQDGDEPLTLDRDNTFPIASAIEALDRAIGLVIDPRHLVELIERRAVLEAHYEAAVDAAEAARESLGWVASEAERARRGGDGFPPQAS